MGKVTPPTSASVSLPKRGKNMTLRSEDPEGLVPFASTHSRVPSKDGLRGGPQFNWVTAGSLEREGREEGQGVKSSTRPWKAVFPTLGGAKTHPRSNIPSLPTHTRQPQHLSLLPASPSVPRRLSDRAPERSPVAPPLAASPQRTRPPTRRRQGLLNPAAEGCRARPPRLLPGLPERRAGARLAAQRVD